MYTDLHHTRDITWKKNNDAVIKEKIAAACTLRGKIKYLCTQHTPWNTHAPKVPSDYSTAKYIIILLNVLHVAKWKSNIVGLLLPKGAN
jgi:hypothetical protein